MLPMSRLARLVTCVNTNEQNPSASNGSSADDARQILFMSNFVRILP